MTIFWPLYLLQWFDYTRFNQLFLFLDRSSLNLTPVIPQNLMDWEMSTLKLLIWVKLEAAIP